MGSSPAYYRPDLKMFTIFLLSGARGLTSEIPLSTFFRNGCKVAVSSANITAWPLAARAQQPGMNSSSVWDETTVPISHRRSGVA